MLETGNGNGVGGVSSACFFGNGHQLLIGLTSPVVSLWDTETESVIRNYVVRERERERVCHYVMSHIIVHCMITSLSFSPFKGHSSGVTCLTRNIKDTFLVSGLEDGNLTVHKTSSSQPVTQLSMKEEKGGGDKTEVRNMQDYTRMKWQPPTHLINNKAAMGF